MQVMATRRGVVSVLALALGLALVGAAGTGPGMRAAVRQGLPCAVVNGGMEDVAQTLQPRDWVATSEVRSSPRARNGERSVVFVGRYGSLSQRLAVRRSPSEGAVLTFWLHRDAALDDFRLRVYVGGVELALTIGPAQLPVDAYTPFQVTLPPQALVGPDADLVFSYQRNSIQGLLDLDDVEMDLCTTLSPTPPPGGSTPVVPDTVTCAVRNGGFEVLEGVRPRFWDWNGNVESTTRALQSGARAVRFTQGNATLTQQLTGVPDQARAARLWLWVYREEGSGGFRLQARVAGQSVLDYSPANLPVGQLPVAAPFDLPAPGPSGAVTVAFEWAMSGSGAVYVDDVALDLCPAAVTATATATATPRPSPTATPTLGPWTPSPSATAQTSPSSTPRVGSPSATPSRPTPSATPRTGTPSRTPTATRRATPVIQDTPSPPVRSHTVHLPYLARGAGMPVERPRVWGLQLPLDGDPAYLATDVPPELTRARRAGLTAMRTDIRWSELEPADTTPNQFQWAATDARLALYTGAGYDVLATVVAYPKWATQYACGGELLPGREADWRELVRALVTRYGRAPYNVHTWEIGNEVDGETTVRADDLARPAGWGRGEPTVPHGGCWGDRAPQYKAFLQAAYEEIKAVDPGARVSIGSLAYVLDDTDFIPDFLENLMAAGAGPYFDVLGYHWFPNLLQPMTGPQKQRHLLDVLAGAGYPKPLWLTETYRLTFSDDPDSAVSQIRFLNREIVEMLAQPELAAVYWYGWQDFPPGYGNLTRAQRGLVRGDHTPKPGFRVLPYAIAYTAGEPSNASAGRVTAWRFQRPRAGEDYVVAWSRDGKAHGLTLPARPGTRVSITWFPEDMLMAGKCCGRGTVTAQGDTVTIDVGKDPVFIDLR
jgi:hypothetical protein